MRREVRRQQRELLRSRAPARERAATTRAWRRGVSSSRATSSSAGWRSSSAGVPIWTQPAGAHHADAVGQQRAPRPCRASRRPRSARAAPHARRTTACSRSRVSGSSAPNGSSSSITRGEAASARATPTRCCCPPDSSAGNARGAACRRARAAPAARRRAPPTRSRVPAREPERNRDVLGHRQVREQADALEHIADRAPQHVRLERGRVLAVDRHAPRVRLDEPIDHLERRGLARARAADEHHQLAGRDLERDRVDRDRVAVAATEARDLDHARRGLRKRSRSRSARSRTAQPSR